MMNGKYLGLTNSTFSGKPFTSTNTITGNGVLFTLSEKADYIYNLFEYVKSDPELDSVRNFLYMSDPYQFHKIRFNSKASVPGDIIKGQQHYLDSVTTTENEFLIKRSIGEQVLKDTLVLKNYKTKEAITNLV